MHMRDHSSFNTHISSVGITSYSFFPLRMPSVLPRSVQSRFFRSISPFLPLYYTAKYLSVTGPLPRASSHLSADSCGRPDPIFIISSLPTNPFGETIASLTYDNLHRKSIQSQIHRGIRCGGERDLGVADCRPQWSGNRVCGTEPWNADEQRVPERTTLLTVRGDHHPGLIVDS